MKAKQRTSNGEPVSLEHVALLAAFLAVGAACYADTIYVSYSGDNTIRKFDSFTGADLGVFASTGLNQPQGLAFDSTGNLFVANYGNNTIMKFTSDGVGTRTSLLLLKPPPASIMQSGFPSPPMLSPTAGPISVIPTGTAFLLVSTASVRFEAR